MNELEDIQEYLKGQLKGDALDSLLQKMKSDPDFKNKVEDFRNISESFTGLQTEALHKQVSSWAKDLPRISDEANQQADASIANQQPDSSVPGTASRFRKIAAMAGIAILFGAVAWFFFAAPKESGQQNPVAALYVEFDDTPITASRRGGGDKVDPLNVAYGEYQNQDFEKSLQSLSAFQPADSLLAVSQYLKGYNYYQLEKYSAAVKAFNIGLAADDTHKNTENAEWARLLSLYQLVSTSIASPANRDSLIAELQAFIEKPKFISPAYRTRAIKLAELLANQ